MFTDLLDQPRRELEALRAQCSALQLECAEQKGRVQELETRMEKQKKRSDKLEAEQKGYVQELETQLEKYKKRSEKLEVSVARQEQTIFRVDVKFDGLQSKQRVQMSKFESKLKQLDEYYVNQRMLNLVRSIHTVSASMYGVAEPPQVVYEGMRVHNRLLQYGSHAFFKNAVYVPHMVRDIRINVSIFGLGEPVEIFMFHHPSTDLKNYCNAHFGVQEGEWTLFMETPFEFLSDYTPSVVYRRVVEGNESQSSLKLLPDAHFYIFKYV
jgi:hypothetical protein